MWNLLDEDDFPSDASHAPERVAPVLPLFGTPFEDEGLMGWQDRALCAQTDPEAFFPEKGGSTRAEKLVKSGYGTYLLGLLEG